MDQVVLDTSVIAKLFLKEEGSDIALRFKEEHVSGKIDIIAPSLLKYELVNVLKYKNFNKQEIIDALEVIKDYGFSIVEPDEVLFNKIAEMSVNYNISSYDSAYVALADYSGCKLYTADAQLLLKTKKLKFVKGIKEF